MKCEECGREFTGKRISQRFCSGLSSQKLQQEAVSLSLDLIAEQIKALKRMNTEKGSPRALARAIMRLFESMRIVLSEQEARIAALEDKVKGE